MSELVGNPEDRLSHNEAHLIRDSRKGPCCPRVTSVCSYFLSFLFLQEIVLGVINKARGDKNSKMCQRKHPIEVVFFSLFFFFVGMFCWFLLCQFVFVAVAKLDIKKTDV